MLFLTKIRFLDLEKYCLIHGLKSIQHKMAIYLPNPLLKGLRYREGLSQIDFAKKLNVSQTNLSAMENGRRAIGKELAKRIAVLFEVDYRIFL